MSEVSICNSALQKIGEPSIISLDDPTKAARQCKLAYDDCRKTELRKYRWNFAIKRVALAPDILTPAFDFKAQFTIPSDCLKVILPVDPYCDWFIEGGKILTNNGTILNLRYIYDIEDTTAFDPCFEEVLSVAIAKAIVEPMTNSANKNAVLQNEYKNTVADARRANAFETIPVDGVDDSLWLVRIN